MSRFEETQLFYYAITRYMVCPEFHQNLQNPSRCTDVCMHLLHTFISPQPSTPSSPHSWKTPVSCPGRNIRYVQNFIKIYKTLAGALPCVCVCCTHLHPPHSWRSCPGWQTLLLMLDAPLSSLVPRPSPSFLLLALLYCKRREAG